MDSYTSDESGAPEVYVQTNPASSGRWRVSTSGGSQPRLRRDGKELFYISADRKTHGGGCKAGENVREW
jgi:Tol biopolymer transport system component